jgi:ornithine--oxo-acid transaminase
LLIVDEIQTGMGRCGSALCIEDYDVKPDVVLLGKSLGGGFVPVSCVFGNESVLGLFEPGEHSSTFGGYPLGARMAYESLDLLFESGLIRKTKSLERRFFEELSALKNKYPNVINSFRGKGMLWGIQLQDKFQPWDVANELVDYGIITREANNSVLRICPPLVIQEVELQFLFKQLNLYFSRK